MQIINLLQIFPEQGNFATLKIVRKLRESLGLDEDEIKQINFRQEGQRFLWDSDPMKDVELGEKATDIIIESLMRLDKDNKLVQDQFSLYEKFCLN